MSNTAVDSDDIRGLELFKPLQQFTERLHALYPSPNRKLHYDQYLSLLLLYYFNPVLTSLRGLQQASTLETVQEKLKTSRTSLGSLSEAGHVFSAKAAHGIYRELAEQVGGIAPRHDGLPADLHQILAVDGSLWEFLPRMAAFFWQAGPRSGPPPAFKVHLHYDVLGDVPVAAEVTDGRACERRQLEAMLKPNTLYVVDRGYLDFTLIQKTLDVGSSFLGRAYDRLVYEEVEPLPLSKADRAAGVFYDAMARVGSAPHAKKLKRPLRVIKAYLLLPRQNGLNPKRGCGENRKGIRAERPMELTLITDRQDLSAAELLTLYRKRWHIEIFFRWLKCSMRCKHLLSECENGFKLQLYAALIASLLIMLWTNKKPKLRTLEMLQLHLSGWATQDELMRHIQSLKTVAK